MRCFFFFFKFGSIYYLFVSVVFELEHLFYAGIIRVKVRVLLTSEPACMRMRTKKCLSIYLSHGCRLCPSSSHPSFRDLSGGRGLSFEMDRCLGYLNVLKKGPLVI